MKNMKFWRTALVATLVLTVMLSVTGGTIAWFTDEVTSANNVIKSGTLDVEMSWSDTQNGTYTDASKGAIFTHQLWEPGYTDVKYIKIENKGDLAFKYQIKVVPTVAKSGDEVYLGDVIDVYYKVVEDGFTAPTSAADVKAWNYVSNITSAMNVAEDAVHGAMLDEQKELTVALALHMRESAGNEYQNKSVGDGFVVKLLATQYTHENDSFNNQYDAGATYPSAAVISGTEDFNGALEDAEENAPLVMTLTGDITYDTEGHHGENDITKASSITIDGQGKYKLIATGAGVTPIGDQTAPLTLKNLTVVDESVSYDESAWELSYLELGGTELYCENVIFKDPVMVESQKATFVNCSFVGYTDVSAMYGAWMYNGDAEFINCTFTGTRGMKICDRYAGEVGSVVIDGCTFSKLSEKPGVAIDDHDTQDMKITIKNSTFINCQPGDQSLYIYESDNTAPTLENNTVKQLDENGLHKDGEEGKHRTYYLYDANDLVKFAELCADNQILTGEGKGVTIELMGDVDLAGRDWQSINTMWVNFDGNGHTISNLTASGWKAGLFGYLGGGYVKNVTLHNVNVTGAQVGVVAGAYEGAGIENVKITGSNVVNYAPHKTESYEETWEAVGAVVGYHATGKVEVEIESGATITVNTNNYDTYAALVNEYIGGGNNNNVTIKNNGTVTVTGTPTHIE